MILNLIKLLGLRTGGKLRNHGIIVILSRGNRVVKLRNDFCTVSFS
jgi:hypothetical protein